MICARSESVRVSRGWSRALACVSCVFRGALLDGGLGPPGANRHFDVALYVFYECFAIASQY